MTLAWLEQATLCLEVGVGHGLKRGIIKTLQELYTLLHP